MSQWPGLWLEVSIQQAAGTAILPLAVYIHEIVIVEYNGFSLWLIKINKKLCTWACLSVLHRYLPHLPDCLPGHNHPLKERDKQSPFITVFQQCRLQAEALEECLNGNKGCARLYVTLLFWKVLSRHGVPMGKKGGTWKQDVGSANCEEKNAVIQRVMQWSRVFFLGMEFHEELHNLGTKEGLKGRKLSKAIESFAWNITVLKVSTENTALCLLLTDLWSF